MKTILVTGADGFIGSALAIRLIENGESVIGLDNLNSYYDINLKESRLNNINSALERSAGKWKFYKTSLKN